MLNLWYFVKQLVICALILQPSILLESPGMCWTHVHTEAFLPWEEILDVPHTINVFCFTWVKLYVDFERAVLSFLRVNRCFSPFFQRRLLPQLCDEFNEASVKWGILDLMILLCARVEHSSVYLCRRRV